MKRSRFTDQLIAFALQQAASRTAVLDVCRKMGISEADYRQDKPELGTIIGPSEAPESVRSFGQPSVPPTGAGRRSSGTGIRVPKRAFASQL